MSQTQPPLVRDLDALRSNARLWRRLGHRVALVPTMGALHEGHLALVHKAGALAGTVVVSIFVNPAQFGPGEDFARYPRDEAADLARLTGTKASLVWAPPVELMYPPGFATTIEPKGAANGLDGEIRPHHFAGVATIVLKLFNQVRPDFAVFGEKDYQQLTVVRQIARDLDIETQIVGLATVREADGLALSSRNRYLSPAERAMAPVLYRTLVDCASAIRAGADPGTATEAARAAILGGGFAIVDYVALRDAGTLSEPSRDQVRSKPLRLLAAARIGGTRLIDNVAV